ncbi:type II secretion system major pseudopilin GspG [Hyphobacterium marinum]|uniref:Type II secretion system core protein G n=1 Tax=Hyphobacterium marinum TaxID=3116574 RepID=A0ABU7LW73_9PROT|nr:type II secretion system major pseudopilin GspG [Hyphobacterium sp. Y6023]MEE2565726.1 type II secretion system major pseudopilin GspG [Hyphobacterium sp. Y6023]
MTQNSTRNLPRSEPHKAGYTLTELIIVMVILGLLAAIVGPMLFSQLGRANSRTAETQMASFATSLGFYRLDVGSYPDSGIGLDALVQAPSGATGWSGPYLNAENGVPLDPWGEPYIYELVSPGHAVIRTLGRDKREGGEGEDADISRDIR